MPSQDFGGEAGGTETRRIARRHSDLLSGTLGGWMIVGLFTDLIPVGGVQLAGRHTAAVLARLAAERKWETQFLSLNDAAGEHELKVAGVARTIHGIWEIEAAICSKGCGTCSRRADCYGRASASRCACVGDESAIEEILPRGAVPRDRSLEADERAARHLLATL